LFADSHLTQPPKGTYMIWMSNEMLMSGVTSIEYEQYVEMFVVHFGKLICGLV
jgi:hypothetical protein